MHCYSEFYGYKFLLAKPKKLHARSCVERACEISFLASYTHLWSSIPSSNPMNAIFINFQQKKAEANAHILGSNASNEKQIDGIFPVARKRRKIKRNVFSCTSSSPKDDDDAVPGANVRAFQHLRSSEDSVCFVVQLQLNDDRPESQVDPIHKGGERAMNSRRGIISVKMTSYDNSSGGRGNWVVSTSLHNAICKGNNA